MIKTLIEDKSALKEYVVDLKENMDEILDNYNYNDFDELIVNLESVIHSAKSLKEEIEGIKSWQARK